MIDIIWRNGLLPLIATLIEQIHATTGVLQSDARTAAILGGLGVVSIVAIEDERTVFLYEADVDSGRGIAIHAMLEGILDEGDKKQGCHFQL